MSQINRIEHSWLNGTLKYQNLDNESCHAEALGYYSNRNIRFKYTIVCGRMHGVCRVWHENGQLAVEESYKKDRLHGFSRKWYPNGQLEQETRHHNGTFDGAKRQWNENGAFKFICFYLRGVRHGVCKEWDNSGRLRLETNYEAGQLNGVLNRYGIEGSLICKEVYARGKRIDGKIRDLIISGKLTAQHITRLNNTALRRICLAELGYSRFLAQMKHTVISKEEDYELVRIDWHAKEDPIGLVKVKCPSTGAFYALRVPLSVKTVKEAVAWTFDLKKDEYCPEAET